MVFVDLVDVSHWVCKDPLLYQRSVCDRLSNLLHTGRRYELMTLVLKITAILVVLLLASSICYRLGNIECVTSDLEDTNGKMRYHRERSDDTKPADIADYTNDTVDEDEEVDMRGGEDEEEIIMYSSTERPSQDTVDLYFDDESTESIVISFWPR